MHFEANRAWKTKHTILFKLSLKPIRPGDRKRHYDRVKLIAIYQQGGGNRYTMEVSRR